jgi:hypothetical protein
VKLHFILQVEEHYEVALFWVFGMQSRPEAKVVENLVKS